MTDPNADVTPSDPSPDTDPNDPSPSSAAAVSAVDGDQIVEDRPLRNVIAELDRKNAQRFEELKATLFAAQSRAAAPPATQREYTDQELSQLAAAGDANAQLLLSDRLAARHAAEQARTMSQSQSEQASLAALFGRYPVLRDGSHALTSYATQVKNALLASGRPNDVSTVIEAIKTAIADNPDLAAQSAVRMASSAAPVPRATAPTAAASAPASRRPAPAKAATALTDAQWELAKRYGYKTREDAARAIERTKQRRSTGQSGLGAVRAFIREEA